MFLVVIGALLGALFGGFAGLLIGAALGYAAGAVLRQSVVGGLQVVQSPVSYTHLRAHETRYVIA